MWFFIRIFKKLHISPFLVFLFACLGCFYRKKYVFTVLSAVLLHECGHMISLLVMRKQIQEIRFDLFGALIRSEPLSQQQEIFCALAGPAVNLAAVLIFRERPEVYAIHGALFLFNMLPIYPLDGGRALFCGLDAFLPFERAQRMIHCISLVVSFLLMLMVTSLSVHVFGGWFIMILCGLILLRLGRAAEREGF